MRPAAALLAVVTAAPAIANDLFSSGKAPVFRLEDADRQFAKSPFSGALDNGTGHDACARLLAAYFVALAEAAPYFHRRDANFQLDPTLVQVLAATAGADAFQAVPHFSMMVRRTLIERRLPEGWLENARSLARRTAAPIDLARLAFLADGVKPIDSFVFSLPVLIDRYKNEIALATSAAEPTALDEFRERYLDRDVAWGGLTLFDVERVDPRKPPPGRKKTLAPPDDDDAGAPYDVAHLALVFPTPPLAQIMNQKPPDPARVSARLRPKQYIDVKRAVRSRKFLVRGRIGSIREAMAGVELTDALLFQETDWTQYGGVSSPADVGACPLSAAEMLPLGRRLPGLTPDRP